MLTLYHELQKLGIKNTSPSLLVNLCKARLVEKLNSNQILDSQGQQNWNTVIKQSATN